MTEGSSTSRWLGPPSPLSRDQSRMAATLGPIIWTIVVTTFASLVLSYAVLPRPPRTQSVALMTGAIVLFLACLPLLARGHTRLASGLLVAVTWTATTLAMLNAGGISTPSFSFYVLGIVAAGLLLGARAAVLVSLLSALAGVVVDRLADQGVLGGGSLVFYTTRGVWWIESVLFFSVAGLVYISVRRLREAFEEADASQRVLAQRNDELLQTLEEKQRAQEAEAELQSRLKQSEKLEALGRLAGGVAHDFNNLLVVIQGYAEMLEREAAEGSESRESAHQIVLAASQAASLTGQLLTFGRQQVHHMRVVDLNRVIVQATDMLRRLVPQDIVIETDLDDAVSAVEVDPDQVHQILMNLVANARDAMPEGGRVTLRTRQVDGRVNLTVTDEGEGMDATTRDRIFEPFFTTKQQGRGTGLGLASVYGIVEDYGGSIRVESAPGRGSTFVLSFAANEMAPAESDEALLGAVDVAPALPARILVVEDQDAVRRLLCRALTRLGHRVIDCRNGEEALTRPEVTAGEIDLVLTDVMMPRVDGPTLVQRLRAHFPGIPVLYTSGHPPGGLARDVQADPRADFLPKPFREEELASKIAALLRRTPDD